MPVFRNNQTIAIAGSVENILVGSQFEILPFTANIWSLRFGLVASVDLVFADVYSGTDILMENGEISDAARWPVDPDDFDIVDVAQAGERIKIRLRNDNAAAAIVQTIVKFIPLA